MKVWGLYSCERRVGLTVHSVKRLWALGAWLESDVALTRGSESVLPGDHVFYPLGSASFKAATWMCVGPAVS
jgi:hypothetical protein